jgi:hypothetical protein
MGGHMQPMELHGCQLQGWCRWVRCRESKCIHRGSAGAGELEESGGGVQCRAGAGG